VLFAASELDAPMTRADLLAVRRDPVDAEVWRGAAGGHEVAFKPFTAIGDEPYRLYNRTIGAPPPRSADTRVPQYGSAINV
jgi:hypothetical protein